MKQPLVSVIVPTRNSEQFLRRCLESIKAQTYPNIELIAVDRDSTDDTKLIAKQFTTKVFNHGPERSAQRNFGVRKAKGTYVLVIDSDMEVGPNVVNACVEKIQSQPKIMGVIIPEESFGVGFWAQCKRLERSFYVGVDWIEAARFVNKATYEKVDGYDESMISGEDWDLTRRIEAEGQIRRITEFIRHNEGHIKLLKHLKKKYYYAQHAKAYLAKNPERSKLSAPVGPILRYRLFLSVPAKLFKDPVLGTGVLLMKTLEFGAGAFGYVFVQQSSLPQRTLKKILIISHVNANSGAIDRYEEYLERHNYQISKLTHPLDEYINGKSVIYVEGKEVQSVPRQQRGIINLLFDLKLNLQILREDSYDVVIGANNFDAYSAVWARRLFRNTRTKIIYFASDYSERRFSNPLLNVIYIGIERGALKGASIVVSNTKRAEAKRAKLGLSLDKSVVVANSAHLKNPVFHEKKISKEDFIYVGSLTKEHGLLEFLKVCGSMAKTLNIIGDGPDCEKILKLCASYRIDVTYHGQKDHDLTIDFMQKFNGIGLAPYSSEAAKYVYYGSSLKIYEYIACGLPVITSRVTEQSLIASEYNCGIVYDQLDPHKLADSLSRIDLQGFHTRARRFYEDFSQERAYRTIQI